MIVKRKIRENIQFIVDKMSKQAMATRYSVKIIDIKPRPKTPEINWLCRIS
jgi:hypothetical protein